MQVPANKFDRLTAIAELPSVLEVSSQIRKRGQAEYINHTIKMVDGKESGPNYVVEGPDITYCEFREMGLGLILLYLQRMLLHE